MKQAFPARLLTLAMGLAFALALAPRVMLAAAPDAQGQSVAASANPASIQFWNREIAVFRGTLAGATPQDRAERAGRQLDELPLNARGSDLMMVPLRVEGQEGFAFTYHGRVLFFLGSGDLDKESGETLDDDSQRVLANLDEALAAREAERKWPIIRSGLFTTLVGLGLLLLAIILIWRIDAWLAAHLNASAQWFPRGLRLFGFDLLPHISTVLRSLLRMAAWVLTLAAIYSWLGYSLRRFPYTRPWGDQLGAYVLGLVQQFGRDAVHALPGILKVSIIFVIARWITHLGSAIFEQVTNGKIRISWMDRDVAKATQRIFSAFVWVFAVVVAYPYIPGSNTEAFKGISVLVGLIVSLGSTGIINQVMSGLFVVYSRALKTGEWVKVNETEGEVLDVGLLAAKIRTIEGQEVTVPNSVLVATLTTNYTRLGYPDGMIASTTVTIGYDAPWRQVHAMLLLAAERTANIRRQPEPYVLQRQLSDFYPQYTLIVRLVDAKLRIETLSSLHAKIQDVFNEFGVQIMSPHYMIPPDRSIVIPPSKWYEAPAAAGVETDVLDRARRTQAGLDARDG
jgi:small-conductance mechanosensitive channel